MSQPSESSLRLHQEDVLPVSSHPVQEDGRLRSLWPILHIQHNLNSIKFCLKPYLNSAQIRLIFLLFFQSCVLFESCSSKWRACHLFSDMTFQEELSPVCGDRRRCKGMMCLPELSSMEKLAEWAWFRLHSRNISSFFMEGAPASHRYILLRGKGTLV